MMIHFTQEDMRKEWTTFKKAYIQAERRKHHASSSNSPAYKDEVKYSWGEDPLMMKWLTHYPDTRKLHGHR